MSRVSARVQLFLNQHYPSWLEQRGIVAVSGGADSVALFRLLRELLPPEQLIVAHLDHQLRGAESTADAAFVQELAHQHQCQCYVHRVAIGAMEGNLEANARQTRYQWFAKLAAEHGCDWIATGHTLDDQAETVLHRLLRGTGLQGLRGIRPVQYFANSPVPIVRPLLKVRRQELRDYLHSIGQVHREDSSNTDHRFTRNRIRHEVLPVLRGMREDFEVSLAELAEQAEEQQQFFEQLFAEKLRQWEMPRAGVKVILSKNRRPSMSEFELRGVLRHLWQREQWPEAEMTAEHWRRLTEAVLQDAVAIDFPQGVRYRAQRGVVQLWRDR